MPSKEYYVEYYENKSNVYKDLGLARSMFSKKCTLEEFEQMEKTLGLMYLYCPNDLMSVVHATMEEATTRKFYLFNRG